MNTRTEEEFQTDMETVNNVMEREVVVGSQCTEQCQTLRQGGDPSGTTDCSGANVSAPSKSGIPEPFYRIA